LRTSADNDVGQVAPTSKAWTRGEIDVGLVDDDDEGQGRKRAQIAFVRQGAIGIVGVGDEDELRPRMGRHRALDRDPVQPERGIPPDSHVFRASDVGHPAIHSECRGEIDHDIPWFNKGHSHELEQLIGASPTDEVIGGKAREAGDRRAQPALVGIRVAMRVAQVRDGLERARAGAIRVFVRVQLDDVVQRRADAAGNCFDRGDRRVGRHSAHSVHHEALSIHRRPTGSSAAPRSPRADRATL
jgi:hypothetical protein